MTRDDIIRMAEEADLWADQELQCIGEYHPDWHEVRDIRFAALVAAAEREHMIKDGWRQCAKGQRTTQFCGQLEQALLAEREACAKVCEEYENDMGYGQPQKCANAIRARSDSEAA